MNIGSLLDTIRFVRGRPDPVRQAVFMATVASALTDPSSLRMVLQNLIDESPAPWSNQVRSFLDLLQSGLSPVSAVSRVDGLVPQESIVVMRLAETCGVLPQALNSEATRLLNRPSHAGSVFGALCSVFLTGTACLIVLAILAYAVMPHYRGTIEGFEIPISPVTEQLFRVVDLGVVTLAVVCFPVIAGFILLLVPGTRIVNDLAVQGRSRWLEFHPRWGTPVILRLLAVSTAGGLALPDALRAILTEMRPSAVTRGLRRVRDSVAAGQDLPAALQAAGFLKLRERRLLDASCRNHHIDWCLLQLAGGIERRREMKLEQLITILPSLGILAAGLGVGLIVVALFLPLSDLIEHLTRPGL